MLPLVQPQLFLCSCLPTPGSLLSSAIPVSEFDEIVYSTHHSVRCMKKPTQVSTLMSAFVMNFIIVIWHVVSICPLCFCMVECPQAPPIAVKVTFLKIQIWLRILLLKTLQDLPITSREKGGEGRNPLYTSTFSSQHLPLFPAANLTIPLVYPHKIGCCSLNMP